MRHGYAVRTNNGQAGARLIFVPDETATVPEGAERVARSTSDKQKDRLAAVNPKPDALLWLGGCDSSDLSLLPTKSHEAEEADKASDQHRPS